MNNRRWLADQIIKAEQLLIFDQRKLTENPDSLSAQLAAQSTQAHITDLKKQLQEANGDSADRDTAFSDLPCHCVCYAEPVDGGCVCGTLERGLRLYSSCDDMRPMTPEERKLLINEADWYGEGHYSTEELQAMTDRQLAGATLSAWKMYNDSHF